MRNRVALSMWVSAASVSAILALATPAAAVTFATFTPTGTTANLMWQNNRIPAVYKTTPAVTQVIPAVYKTTPAVTKIVNGKTVIVTPAKTVLVTPAKTVVVTPAKTVLVTPAHDGPSGSLFTIAAPLAQTPGSTNVKFSFTNPVLAKLGSLQAAFTFQGDTLASSPALLAGKVLDQDLANGTFSFIYSGASPLRVWRTTYLPGANLLSGTVTNYDIFGKASATSGGVSGSTTSGSAIVFTSDFLDFTKTRQRDFAFALTSISPKLAAESGAALRTFRSVAGGQFSASPQPKITAVPEPATWAMMLLGFFGLGSVVRRRKATSALV